MLHAASGATLGRFIRSRRLVLTLGFCLHLLEDAIPHEDTDNQRFEMTTGLVALGIVASRRGLFEPATLGAVACCLPDAEHLLPLPRPGGLKLFHEGRGWHKEGAFSIRQQILAAALLLAVLPRPQGARLPGRRP